MKKIHSFFLFAALIISMKNVAQQAPVQSDGLQWYTDMVKANEASKAGNKPIFALFTGSDWCFWCKKLQANVLSKPAFIEWAKKNVILVELDFPRYKALSQEQMQQNQSLQQTFGVQGYPTIWVFSMKQEGATGKYSIEPVGSLGYPQNAEPGKEEVKFLKDATELMNKKVVKQ